MVMKNVAYAMCCDCCEVRCGNDAMLSDVVVGCKIKIWCDVEYVV